MSQRNVHHSAYTRILQHRPHDVGVTAIGRVSGTHRRALNGLDVLTSVVRHGEVHTTLFGDARRTSVGPDTRTIIIHDLLIVVDVGVCATTDHSDASARQRPTGEK